MQHRHSCTAGSRGSGTWNLEKAPPTGTIWRAIHCNGETPQICQSTNPPSSQQVPGESGRFKCAPKAQDPASAHFQLSWFAALGQALGCSARESQARPTWRFPESGPLLCLSVLVRGALRVPRLDWSGPSRVISCTHSCRSSDEITSFAHLSMHRSMPNSRHPQPILETRQHQLMAASVRTR